MARLGGVTVEYHLATASRPALFLAVSTSAPAQAAPAPGNPSAVAVVVRIATPAGVTREQVVALMAAAVPQYESIPGLVRKYFTIADDNTFGGIYLFRNRAAAESFFSAAWFANVKKTYGVDANVRYFSSPIQIEGTKADANP